MNDDQIFYPSTTVKFFLWGPAVLLLVIFGVESFINYQLISWLYESYPLDLANSITSWFFRIFASWVLLIAFWIAALGIKSTYLAKYPPGGMPIPLKTSLLEGKRARNGGILLCIVGFFAFLLGAAFVYTDYIWSSSGL